MVLVEVSEAQSVLGVVMVVVMGEIMVVVMGEVTLLLMGVEPGVFMEVEPGVVMGVVMEAHMVMGAHVVIAGSHIVALWGEDILGPAMEIVGHVKPRRTIHGMRNNQEMTR